MILIGQYDSPFVRRVAIALRLYGFAYEHRPWSVFGDADKIAAYNPLRRVPTLVLDDGEVVIESTVILDCIDEMAGPQKALLPEHGRARREGLKICALATGLGDKAVSLVYEQHLHKETSAVWIERCRTQIGAGLDALEADKAARPGVYWFGERLSHADIAVACVMRFASEAHASVFSEPRWPKLAAHAARCEALEPFQAIQQPFFVSAPKAQ